MERYYFYGMPEVKICGILFKLFKIKDSFLDDILEIL